jgi:hypothetical protein
MGNNHTSLRKNQRAVSPAISTIILTATTVVMLLVVMSYGNNFLNSGMAENEFNGNKQFMQTTGLQIDDIAWTTGRTQTVSYSAKYGSLNFTQSVLEYTIQVHTNAGWQNLVAPLQTGIIQFKMPASSYSLGNNYFTRVPQNANSSFLQTGSSAPVSQVFCEEKIPMSDGTCSRIVVVPMIRELNSSITGTQQTTGYYKFYLPLLSNGTNLYRSQSVTLTGSGITKLSCSDVDQVRVTVDFPKQSAGFDSSFFKFDQITQTMNLPANSVVEFYVSDVVVAIGQV